MYAILLFTGAKLYWCRHSPDCCRWCGQLNMC